MSTDIENQRITTVPILKPDASRNRPDVALTARRILSIQVPNRQPSARIPVEFRTLSLQLETGNTQPVNHGTNGLKVNIVLLLRLQVLFSPTPQTYPSSNVVDEALRRFWCLTGSKTGIDAPQSQRRVARHGLNQTSPPPSRMLRKVLGWFFGGFWSPLLAANIVCFLAW